MRKERTYSVFVKDDGKWVRVTPLALKLSSARRLFQGILLGGSVTGRAMELKPAEENMERADEYAANMDRIFPKSKGEQK